MREPKDVLAGNIPILAPLGHLPLRVRSAVRMTDEALFEFCRLNRDLRIERTREGELLIMSPRGGETGHRNYKLIVRIGAWVEKDGSGIGFDSSTGFLLPNGAERSPDFAWIKKERWEALSAETRRRFAPLCPDFVIELRSPSDDLVELQAKMQEYLENGTSLGWLLDPDSRQVYLYRPGARAQRLDNPASLSGETVLPGLVLDLAGIW